MMKTESNSKFLSRRWLFILISTGLALAVGFFLLKGRFVKSEFESMLIQSDAPCKVNVDGDEMILAKPGSVSFKVTSGQHLVSAVSLEENVVWEDLVYVENGKDLTVNIRLAAKVAATKQNKFPVRIE